MGWSLVFKQILSQEQIEVLNCIQAPDTVNRVVASNTDNVEAALRFIFVKAPLIDRCWD